MFEVVSRRQVRSCDLDLARSATCLWKGRNCQAAERRLDALALKQNLLDTGPRDALPKILRRFAKQVSVHKTVISESMATTDSGNIVRYKGAKAD